METNKKAACSTNETDDSSVQKLDVSNTFTESKGKVSITLRELYKAAAVALPSSGTQARICVELLLDANGEFVPLNHFIIKAHCGAFHSVASSLRKQGYVIENKIGETLVKDGIAVRESFYRLHKPSYHLN